MKTNVRTIMNARAKQRKTSLIVQGFKCHEIGYKKYLSDKTDLERLEKKSDLLPLEKVVYIRLYGRVKEYEKKHNINKNPKKPVVKEQGFMSKVRSLFSRKKR